MDKILELFVRFVVAVETIAMALRSNCNCEAKSEGLRPTETPSIHDTAANIELPPQEIDGSTVYTPEVMKTWSREVVLAQADKFGIAYKPQTRTGTLLGQILKRVKGLEKSAGMTTEPEPKAETAPEPILKGATEDLMPKPDPEPKPKTDLFGDTAPESEPEPALTESDMIEVLKAAVMSHGAELVGGIMAKVYGKKCNLKDIAAEQYAELKTQIEAVIK